MEHRLDNSLTCLAAALTFVCSMLAADSKVVPLSEPMAAVSSAPCDWKQIVQPLEPFLQAVAERLAEQVQAFDADLACYAEYALTGQGKHLRPALVGLSAGATGGINDAHISVAAIIEMVHLATLVHDDVMDEAILRRGRPTLAANWGNELSVLFGDCLFAHALKLAASFPTPDICRAVASATNTVCSGEIVQTQQRCNFGISRADYFKVLEMKTGELFALVLRPGRLPEPRPRTRAAKPSGNSAWPSAPPTRSTTTAWICSARRKPPASRWAPTWPRAN